MNYLDTSRRLIEEENVRYVYLVSGDCHKADRVHLGNFVKSDLYNNTTYIAGI